MNIPVYSIFTCLFLQIVAGKTLPIRTDIDSNVVCDCDHQIGNNVDDDDIQFRIVGGEITKPHGYPQMIFIDYNSFRCGGTIINSEYILTAAHCVLDQNTLSLYLVEAGKHDLYRIEKTQQDLKLKKIIIHPKYNPKNKENDIAVLQLTSPLTFNQYVKPTCLPLFKRSYFNQIGTAVGWGNTVEGGLFSPFLREVDLPIKSRVECAQYFVNRNFDSMFCAGFYDGGKDTCGGDSGGPLFIKSTSPPTQVGVISFGIGCGRPKRPGMNSDVGYNIEFILNNTKLMSNKCQVYSHDKKLL